MTPTARIPAIAEPPIPSLVFIASLPEIAMDLLTDYLD
jgi:hypothetical protein